MTTTAYSELMSLRRETATLGSVASLVSWDQETYMPEAAAEFRAQQQAMLAGMVHERATSPRVGELLDACGRDASLRGDEPIAAELREIRKDYDKATRLPAELVRELAETGSRAQEAWKKAREASDFAAFAPWLTKMVGLTRRKAECLREPGMGELYDALLEEYEPGARAADLERVFTPLRQDLSAFIADVATRGRTPDTGCLDVRVEEAAQHRLGLRVLGAMGFDLKAGRLDTTAHPFCSGFAPGDTRLTTRYRESRFTDALYGTMHEGGHGLYEQGLPKGERFGSPLADAVSLGIHESQSRMWENLVGRSREFWTWCKPIADECFGGALSGVSAERMFGAVNTARPSFIRVEADEATYNLHVMLRFEIERGLISGDLPVRDVPGVWNENFERLLGLKVPDDARGCLQDVHWSFGLFGYFPTYTLGNLYAAQFWEAIGRAVPDRDARVARGDFGPILAWNREHIHRHGRRYSAAEVCTHATGQELSSAPLMRHLASRVRPAYGMVQ